MAVSYRYYLEGHGPYESEKFDTEDDARKFAAANHQDVSELINFDSTGTPSSTNREVINLDAAPAAVPPAVAPEEAAPGDAAADQAHTDGTQPA